MKRFLIEFVLTIVCMALLGFILTALKAAFLSDGIYGAI
jgi:hypothetical protein